MMLEKIAKTTAAFLAATMLGNSCIAPQTYSWKTESVIKTEYQPIKQETLPEMRYEITSTLTENGTLDIAVERNWYAVSYDFLTPINIERQREYSYGKNLKAAKSTNYSLSILAGGWALYGIGMLSCHTVCYEERAEILGTEPLCLNECPDELLGTGALFILGGGISSIVFSSKYNRPKMDRPTKNYRQLEVPLDNVVRKETSERMNTTNPAIHTILQIKAATEFTINGQYTADITTDENGHATIQLEPTNPNFAFSQDDLANTEVAKQLQKAGYPKTKYLPLLQNAAVPISYDVVIETKATDGENATETAHVPGCVIPQETLEGIIMGL